MVDAQAVDEALARRAEHQRVGVLEHLGVLLADAGEIVDVEEAPVAPGHRVDVEEPLAQRRVGPVAVRLVGRHVVGDDVEHDPHAGVARRRRQRAELVLSAERLGEPARVDHVVAVRRARARLERRRQIEVRDPEVAQVRDQLPRRGEAEIGGQLQAVGRPQLGRRSADPLEHDESSARSPAPRCGRRSVALPASALGVGGRELERPLGAEAPRAGA